MQLRQLQQQFQDCLRQSPEAPKTAHDALQLMEMCCKRAAEGLTMGYTPSVQVFMEQALAYLLFSYHFVNLDVEQVAEREIARWKASETLQNDRVILVFKDHAELRVDGELRGTIPVYEQADHTELKQIAHLFSCRLEYADHLQLTIFESRESVAS